MEMTASLRKFVVSLSSGRHRRIEQAFVAEGTKCVTDTLGSFGLRYLIATEAWAGAHEPAVAAAGSLFVQAPRKELERMSSLSTAPEVIAVYDMPAATFDPSEAERDIVVALDGVQDPGNVGTIIRSADWFGVRTVICSEATADAFSAKAIMATMGAISRVKVVRGDIAEMLRGCSAPVMGTFLEGEDIYHTDLPTAGVLVMGNEGKGICSEVEALVSKKLFIPSYPAGVPTVESLNVGMATSIALAEFRRRVNN
jgi:TrmH family RNA methyltransferase